MVDKLFKNQKPSQLSSILDPGCGPGDFIDGILRWCHKHEIQIPNITGVELNPKHVKKACEKYQNYECIQIQERDFLLQKGQLYDYIIGNPPYVPITELTKEEKELYRPLFKTARERFDLYLLFFEKAISSLKEGGRLVFVTPEKFTYVKTAKPLRILLKSKYVKELELLDESSFPDLITYPTITTFVNSQMNNSTRIITRDGENKEVKLSSDGTSWLPSFYGNVVIEGNCKLKDVCLRISPGVATGADKIFIRRNEDIPPELRPHAYRTISGRQLFYDQPLIETTDIMLIPYTVNRELIDISELGSFADYLLESENKKRLEERTCTERKPWYAFHETPPLDDILQPKILCKDITLKPDFWIDREGTIVPRHTVYYLIPKNPEKMDEIVAYLKSDDVIGWFFSNCQRAHNGFIRLQSNILKELPIPDMLYAKLI